MRIQLHLHLWGGNLEDPQGPIAVSCSHAWTTFTGRGLPAYTATGLTGKKGGIAFLACHSLEAGFFNAEHWKHVFIIRVFVNNPIITTLRMINVAKSNVLQIVPLHKPFWCIPSPGWGPETAPLAQCRRPTIPSRCHLRCKWQSVSRQGWTLQHSPGQQRKEPQVKKKEN